MKTLLILCLCVLHSAIAITFPTDGSALSVPPGDSIINQNADGSYSVTLTESGWVSSDVLTSGTNAQFYVIINSATATAGFGVILLDTIDNPSYYDCGESDGYDSDSSLVGLPTQVAPCNLADVATIYTPATPLGSTTAVNGFATLNVPINVQLNYYTQTCVEVAFLGIDTVNQGGFCEPNYAGNITVGPFMSYGIYFEVEAGGVASFTVGTGSICQTGCATCTAYATCQSCSTGYTLVGTQCVPVTTPKPTCNPSCSQCDTSRTVTSGTNVYYVCTQCPSGQYVNADQYECSTCPTGCATCTGPTVCQSCAPGYTLSGGWGGGQCVPTTPTPTCYPSCKQCDTTKTVTVGQNVYYVCAQCPSGQYINSDKYECTACTTGCATCTDANTCQSCSAGYTLVGTKCVQTSPKPTCYPSCKQCDTTKTVTVGSNVYYVCAQCPSGQYVNPDKYECSACSSNCASCTSATSCQCCNAGYVLNKAGQCIPKPTCHPSCRMCDYSSIVTSGQNTYYACTACSFGQYLNSDKYECSSCPANCNLCNSANTCQVCAHGYQLIGSQCVKPICSPTCASCDFSQVISNLLPVPVDNIINSSAYYLCNVCPKSTYLKPNKCECAGCPAFCTSCIAGALCTSCAAGYIPINYQCVPLHK